FLAVLYSCATRQTADTARVGDIDIPEAKPASSDRRASVRFAVDLGANVVPFHQTTRGRWAATILDVSLAGVRLEIPHSVPVNSVLQLTLDKRATSQLVLARWTTPSKGQLHFAGCSFVHPLSSQDFAAIRG